MITQFSAIRPGSIPESSLEALIRLHEDGYKIALASGRAFRSDSLPEEFHGRFAPDCLVSSNGAIIEIEGKLIHEKFFRSGAADSYS